MKWLLDTNVISESVSRRGNAGVLGWIARQPLEDTAISVLTLAELRDGVALTTDENRKRELALWMDASVMISFKERIIALTTDVLVDWLGLMRTLSVKGRPQTAADLLLASTARVHELTLVTRNSRHFANTGITIYNPWTNETQKMEMP